MLKSVKRVILIVVITMKKERKVLRFSILVNLFVSILKLALGIIWNTFSLTIDGIYTVNDLVTDVIAIYGVGAARKRANKNHPYGFGRVFYIVLLFMGIASLLVGVFVIYLSFKINYVKPPFAIVFVILGTVFLKIISARKLFLVGKKEKSDLLLVSSFESRMEAYSSIGLIIIIILSQFIPKIDMIGGIFIALILIYQAFKTIKNNIALLIGITYDDDKIEEKIRKIVNKYSVINITDLSLMKDGPYYQVTITLKVDKNIKVGRLVRIQNKIKKELKVKPWGLKFILFHIT